jgi:hypothetical protein
MPRKTTQKATKAVIERLEHLFLRRVVVVDGERHDMLQRHLATCGGRLRGMGVSIGGRGRIPKTFKPALVTIPNDGIVERSTADSRNAP